MSFGLAPDAKSLLPTSACTAAAVALAELWHDSFRGLFLLAALLLALLLWLVQAAAKTAEFLQELSLAVEGFCCPPSATRQASLAVPRDGKNRPSANVTLTIALTWGRLALLL